MSILWKPDLSDTRLPLVRIAFRILKIRLGRLLSRLLRAPDHEILNNLSPVAVLAKAFQGVTPSFDFSNYQFSLQLLFLRGCNCLTFSVRNVSHDHQRGTFSYLLHKCRHVSHNRQLHRSSERKLNLLVQLVTKANDPSPRIVLGQYEAK